MLNLLIIDSKELTTKILQVIGIIETLNNNNNNDKSKRRLKPVYN